MIKYIKGDILANLKPNTCLPHCCNIFSVLGGFAGYLAKNFPENARLYKKYLEERNFPAEYYPTTYFHKTIEGILIANMICQTTLDGPTKKNIKYIDLATCMHKVLAECEYADIEEIQAPKFGAGLGGLDWNFLRN